MSVAAGSSFWSPSAPQLWEHCRPSSPSSMVLFLPQPYLGACPDAGESASTGIISSFSHISFFPPHTQRPVKEHSTADSLQVKEDRPPPWPEGTGNSNCIAGQEAPAEALPKFPSSLRKRHQKENFVNFPTQYHVLCLSKSHKNGNAIQKRDLTASPSTL